MKHNMIYHIIRAAKLGGEEIMTYFWQHLDITGKGSARNFRTQADLASEAAVLGELKKHFLDYNYYSEEKGWEKNDSEYTFVIDPLDGTNNFSLGMPMFSVSIALQKGDETIAAVVYHPVINQTFYAEKGKGAYCGDKKLAVNDVTDLSHVTLSFTCGYDADPTLTEKVTGVAYGNSFKRLLTNWGPAFEYGLLAAGKLEAVLCFDNDIYDNLAGKLLVKESGGVIVRIDGSPEADEASVRFIAANNSEVAQQLATLFSNVDGLDL